MSLSSVIQLFVLIPLAGFIISLFPVERAERLLSRTAILTSVLNLLGLICFTPVWIFKKHPVLSLKELTLFSDNQYEFSICFYFDKISALYLLVGALLTFLITIYSQYYLHREEGYKGIALQFYQAISRPFLQDGKF
jgi:NADH:ubiquinone oxidoreductase subunit 5 (subunit L)/multisubunit Na+/H+ antiporter MnhA subunit